MFVDVDDIAMITYGGPPSPNIKILGSSDPTLPLNHLNVNWTFLTDSGNVDF